MFHVNEGFWIDRYWRHDLDFPEHTNIEARFYVTEQIYLHEIKDGRPESRTASKVLFHTSLDKYKLASLFATLSMRGETEKSYNEALAFLFKQKDSPSELERECADSDKIMAALGMTVEQARTEGGSLNLPKILARIAEGQAREQQLREALEKTERLPYDEVPDHQQTIAHDALALPQDDTALRQWGAKLLREMAEQTSDDRFYNEEYLRRKADELEAGK